MVGFLDDLVIGKRRVTCPLNCPHDLEHRYQVIYLPAIGAGGGESIVMEEIKNFMTCLVKS